MLVLIFIIESSSFLTNYDKPVIRSVAVAGLKSKRLIILGKRNSCIIVSLFLNCFKVFSFIPIISKSVYSSIVSDSIIFRLIIF